MIELLYFSADWCVPCKTVSPTIDEIAKRYADRVTVTKIDVDKEKEKQAEYGIVSLPTVLIVKGGVVVDGISGAHGLSRYEDLIKGVLNGN